MRATPPGDPSGYYAGFFRRVKGAETPGYSRFKPKSRRRQLEFPHGNRALKFNADQRRVRIPGVGTVRLRKGRAVPAFGRAFVVEKNVRCWGLRVQPRTASAAADGPRDRGSTS